MLVHRRVDPSSTFAGNHLYTRVERGTMGVKCLAQEHNTVPRPGLEPGPFDPESSALTIRPPRLPHILYATESHKLFFPFLVTSSSLANITVAVVYLSQAITRIIFVEQSFFLLESRTY